MMEIKDIKIEKVSGIQCTIDVRDSGSKEWKNFKRRAKRNRYSLPKQVLVDTIKEEIKKKGTLQRDYDSVVEIKLEPCGGEAKYKTWDDIPNKSVPCPCGDPSHWLIEYRDIRG